MISQEEFEVLKSFAARIPPNDPGAHNNLAIVYYNKGLYDEAIEELEMALKIDPNFVLARNNLDIVLKKAGRLEEKVEQLTRSIDREPYDEKKTLELAETYRKLNRHSQAIISYKKILDFNPGSFEAHYGLGITLKLLGKYGDALEEIKKSLEIRKSPELYRILGEIYFSKGIIDLAIQNFQETIKLDSSSAEAHFLLGFALGEKGKMNESLEAVKKAIALNPALAQFEPNLPIDIKEHKGHWEFLRRQLGTPKATGSEYDVHYNLGMTYRNKGLFDEAKREFDECIKSKADEPDLNFLLGEVSLYLNKVEDAIEYFQHAYKSDFDSVRCMNALGVVYCLKGNLEEAIQWFERALSSQNDFVPALNNLAVCQFNQGNSEEAIKYYDRAVERGSPEASFNLGMYYIKNGNYDSALKLFSGDTADAYFGKGLVNVELGNNDEALDFFKKALSVVPNHAGANYNMGFVLTKIGKFRDGLNFIRKGIESEANYEKDKFRLSLEPELSEFGPYYIASAGKIADESVISAESLPKHETPRAADYVTDAENYLNENNFENALSMVEHALQLEPEMSKAVILKARILFQTGSTDDAIKYLTIHTQNHAHDTEIKATLARMLQETERLNEAKEIYSELVKLEPNNDEWLTELAEILYSVNELNESLSLYRRLYELDANNIAANLGFLKISIKNRDLNKAATYLDFFKEKNPDVYDFNIFAGLYYLAKNEYDDALRYFQKAIELDASRPLPYYHLGLLQIKKGDFDSACNNWRKALLLNPEQELAQKIKQCLKITTELSEFLKKET